MGLDTGAPRAAVARFAFMCMHVQRHDSYRGAFDAELAAKTVARGFSPLHIKQCTKLPAQVRIVQTRCPCIVCAIGSGLTEQYRR
mmetsp:Transcript_83451/g.210368  ORF Transcript_83451/g.210368 Transcript_83451/m.210368 type:complete len:85 (+) Transcript_83451:141-395(+)